MPIPPDPPPTTTIGAGGHYDLLPAVERVVELLDKAPAFSAAATALRQLLLALTLESVAGTIHDTNFRAEAFTAAMKHMTMARNQIRGL